MVNTIGEKELKTDWDATTAADSTKDVGHEQNLVAETSLISQKSKVGM